MIVSFDKNHKLRLTYDGRSYIIHNHNNHYYINKDNEKIYCTNEVKKFYKNSLLTKHQNNVHLPIIHTLQMFKINEHKYIVEKFNNNYCVHKNGIYLCNNEVQKLTKQIYGGVPVKLSTQILDFVDISRPKFREDYETRKNFIDSLVIDLDGGTENIKIIYECPNLFIEDLDDDDLPPAIVFKKFIQVSSGAYGRIMFPTEKYVPKKDVLEKYNLTNCKLISDIVVKEFKSTLDREQASIDLTLKEGLYKADPDNQIKKQDYIIAQRNYLMADAAYREIDMIEKLNRNNLFKESTYARVVRQTSQVFIIMERAVDNLLNIRQALKKITNNCNYIKIVYAIFNEIYNMYNMCNTVTIINNLYVDIKLENFLFTFNENDKILQVIMTDYGSFQQINTQLIEEYISFNRYDLKTVNWIYVSFALGCCLLKLYNIRINTTFTESNYISEVIKYILELNSRNITQNEINLLVLLLGIKINSDNTYELLKYNEMLDTPDKIIDTFNSYKNTASCDLTLHIINN